MTSKQNGVRHDHARPNILLFLTDDHGAWATSFDQRLRGIEPEVHSPNLDWIASQGTAMTSAYTPSPVCSPARACFWTGKMPSQTGVHDWLVEGCPEWVSRNWLGGELTLPEIIRYAGYRTYHSGKWHLGESEKPQPGFDEWFSIWPPQPGHHVGRFKYSDQGEPLEIDGYVTDIVTDRAVDMIHRHDASEPFLLSVGYIGTHSSWATHPERIVQRYRGLEHRDAPKLPMHPHQRPFKECHGDPEIVSQYYASVTHIDEGVGRILDALDAEGALDNTIIVYTSDHGVNMGHHGIFGKGNGTEPKNMHEGSARVPMVWRIPGATSPGSACSDIVDHCDFLPTLLGAAGIELPDDRRLDSVVGRSYAAQLRGVRNDWDGVAYGEYGPVRSIRTDRYMYVHRYSVPDHAQDQPHDLFDLVEDPRELRNVVADPAYGSVRDQLRHQMEEWFSHVDTVGLSGLDMPHDSSGQTYPLPGQFEPR